MMTEQYEIEIKSLLGSRESADALLTKMHTFDAETKCIGESSQLNHYFITGDTEKIFSHIAPYVSEEKQMSLKKILYEGKNISIRTRKANDRVLFVIKASIDDTTSSNGTARLEFETEMPDLSLDMLDHLLLDSDCVYQAKWSRDRKEYAFQDMTVCIDKNAGYGYIAEFEKIVTDGSEAEVVKKNLRETMQRLQVQELDQERLARMFAHYNEHWSEYYGTEKTFTIL